MKLEVVAVGLHSLHFDEFLGSPLERHVFFADLDSHLPGEKPAAFREAMRAAMHEFNVRVCYVFRTLKGYHVVSCDLGTRRETERFEERLRAWGADSMHGGMSYRNGGAVLRVSPKPGEPRGPELVRTFYFHRHEEVQRREWSGIHYDFLNELHGGKLPPPGYTLNCAQATAGVRLERYTTTARAPREAAPLV